LAAITPVRQQDHERDDDAEPGMSKPNSARLRGLRQHEQDLVERRQQEVQHPDRDAEGHPDEEAGDQVALHRDVRAGRLVGDRLGFVAAGRRASFDFDFGGSRRRRVRSSRRAVPAWRRPSRRRSRPSRLSVGFGVGSSPPACCRCGKSVTYQPEPFS
jgi:hypothetical protein